MRQHTQALIWFGVVGMSLGLHAVAFGGLGRHGWRDDGFSRTKRKPALVEVSVSEPKPKAPEPPRPAEPVTRRLALARPARVKAAPATPSAPPPPAAETPADFTGQTLTNDAPGAGGWSSAAGNGEKMNGPAGRPGARVTSRVVDGAPVSDGHGPPTVGLGDLSRLPAAPDLADALSAAYPAAARARGQAGKAVVRARIMPDGRARELALVSESAAGFGVACEHTLRDSRWSPPLDQGGRAVSTFINYTCRFNVE